MMRGYATGGLVGGSGCGIASPFGVSVYAPVSHVTTGGVSRANRKGAVMRSGKPTSRLSTALSGRDRESHTTGRHDLECQQAEVSDGD